MSIINLGNQYITWDYKHPANARDFNTVLREGIKPGIYKGGEITLLGGVEISIAPFVAYLNSGVDKLVRVETRASIQLSITESTPVLSITYTWSDVIENWLDFNQRASGSSPIADEITFGEFIFDSGSIISIDETEKTWGLYHADGNLRIPDGKVGINNNFPSVALDIVGGVNIEGGLDIVGGVDIEGGLDLDGSLTITSTNLVDNLNAKRVDSRSVESVIIYSDNHIPTSKAILDHFVFFHFHLFFSKITASSDSIIVPAFTVKLTTMTGIINTETILTTADLDTGSAFTFGADHYIWAGEPETGTVPVLKISLSATSPAGVTNGRIIGGFHYGKIRNSWAASDVSDGILPRSVWDLTHMPKCYILGLQDPANYQIGGMVEVIPGKLWADIYLASNGGGTTPFFKGFSKINQVPLSGTEGLCAYDFMNRAANVGKRLLTYLEWTIAALGSPQGLQASNLNGWTKTSNTGKVKTGATEAADADADYINGYNTAFSGCRDCVGNLREWMADAAGLGNIGWSDSLNVGEMSGDTNFGRRYGTTICLLAGGDWDDGVYAGSRAVHAYYGPWNVGTNFGSRFCCDSL